MWPGAKLATHEARCQTPGRDLETIAAVMLAAPDATVTARQMIDAATEARRNRADIEQLIAIGFAFEPNVPDQVGPVRIHRVIANRDLQIPGLTPSAGTGALTLLGEPSIQLDHTPDGHLTIEIHGYDTYDPTTRTVRPSDGNDIDSWMIDTAHDGANFFPPPLLRPSRQKTKLLQPTQKSTRQRPRPQRPQNTHRTTLPPLPNTTTRTNNRRQNHHPRRTRNDHPTRPLRSPQAMNKTPSTSKWNLLDCGGPSRIKTNPD